MIREFIHDAIDKFDLISIDIFDTFLLRPFLRPTDLFIRLAGEEFAAVRIDAEKQSRRRFGERTNLDSIYEFMPDKYKPMKCKEVQLEKGVLTVNPELNEVYDLAKANGKKVVFTSDMYLGKDIIADILKAKGITDYDGLYVSCDHGINKGSGELLRKVIRDFNISDTKAMHIGDDFSADIVGGRRSCIYTFYYPKISEVFFAENNFIKNYFERHDRSNNSTIRMFLGALALAYHINRFLHGNSEWYKVGCLLSGVITYTYAKYVVNLCKELNKDRVLLTLRDAYIMGQTADFMFDGIKWEYIYGSRSVLGHTQEALNRGFVNDPNVEYFRKLNIDAKNAILVEGWSNYFTLQNVLSNLVGKPIDTAYFTLNNYRKIPTSNSFSFLTTRNIGDRFCEVYEFCNGSPEPSVSSITDESKIYCSGSDNAYEHYRESVYHKLVDAAVFTSKILNDAKVTFPSNELESYIRHYMSDASLCETYFFINQYKPSGTAGYDYHSIYWR